MSTNDKALTRRGKEVRTLLKSRGWSQAELARRTKIPEYRISRILRGAYVYASEAAILSDTLGTTFTFWTEGM